MKVLATRILVALALVSGYSNAANQKLHTPSAIYTTHFVGAQPSQDIVDACVETGKRAFAEARNSVRSRDSRVLAGNAYEACMKQAGFTPK
jgi:hypothetical protein